MSDDVEASDRIAARAQSATDRLRRRPSASNVGMLRAARLLEDLAHKLPEVRSVAHRRLREVDGWAADRSYRVRTGGAELTGPEAAAYARERITAELEQIEAAVAIIARTASAAVAQCDRMLGYTVEAPRCTGGVGEEGAQGVEDAWGDPTCHKIPEEGRKLCAAHRKARGRWRRRHRRPPTADVVPAAGED